MEHLQDQVLRLQLIFRTDSLTFLALTSLLSFKVKAATHSQHGSSLLILAEISSSSVRLIRVSTTVSVITDSYIKLTGELTPTVPLTSMTTMHLLMVDGYTQHSFMTEQPTLVKFTSMVRLIGKDKKMHLTEAAT